MKRRGHRKLFYPFGLISLALLPFLCFTALVDLLKKRNQPEHTREINFLATKRTAEIDTVFLASVYSKTRKFFTFKLTDDSIHNYYFLEQARRILNKIKSEKDTIHGVNIVFSDSTKYNYFIKAIDNCYERWPYVFGPSGNNLWAIYINYDSTGFYKKRMEWLRQKEMQEKDVTLKY